MNSMEREDNTSSMRGIGNLVDRAREHPDLAQLRQVDIAIITVLPEEYRAVATKLAVCTRDPGTEEAPNLFAWQLGEILSEGKTSSYRVVLAMQPRATNIPSALVTYATAQRWRPRYVLLVGIAGGFAADELCVGDVVYSSLICGYEYGKLKSSFEPRQDFVYRPHHGLLTGAAAHNLRGVWQKRITQERPDENSPEGSRALPGRVASGDKIVDQPDSDFFCKVRAAYPTLLAAEMEGCGACAAVELLGAENWPTHFLMIRGISDMPPNDSRTDEAEHRSRQRDRWKAYAADAASAFCVSFVSSGLPTPPRDSAHAAVESADTGNQRLRSGMQRKTSLAMPGLARRRNPESLSMCVVRSAMDDGQAKRSSIRDSDSYSDGGFLIGQTPISNGFWAHIMSPGMEILNGGNLPKVAVAWTEWMAFCTRLKSIAVSAGCDPATFTIRLPSEDEWILAASGKDCLAYPWGDEWVGDSCNCADTALEAGRGIQVLPVLDPCAANRSPFGVIGTAGNVYEWTVSEFRDTAHGRNLAHEERSHVGSDASSSLRFTPRVLKGGCCNSLWTQVRCDASIGYPPRSTSPWIGARLLITPATSDVIERLETAGILGEVIDEH